MARLRRLAAAGLPHLVRQSAVDGQLLARDDADARAFIDALRQAMAGERVAVWAYALTPHDVHLVVCPPGSQELGRAMQALGRRYVAEFNRRHGRRGALWAGRFRAAVLEPGAWTLAALLGTDRLAAGALAGSAEPHLGQRGDPLLAEAPERWALGNTPFERDLAWTRLLAAAPDPALERSLARAVQGSWVAGSPGFAASVAQRVDRPVAPRRRGRPRRASAAD